jgi:hypothetical protein
MKAHPTITISRWGEIQKSVIIETTDDQRIQLAQPGLQTLYNMCTHWMEKSTFLHFYVASGGEGVGVEEGRSRL